ncbi:YitT family protein [Clostridium sp. YIM B02515]|uniref:YitT family protein n=1 Tax=Clostridium rhizosphaerae TaxID=2803861 RepID=A0ABS1TBJ3_9CLOT|nr:YitT family protein [Clostridium rhizosphaerae]MBL4936641.1 YitT family protein [Clostridium rhizosphaerae]
MGNKNYKKIVIDIIIVTIGCILTAFSITSILKPNGLISGGITGISIILEKFIHIKYTYIYYALSLFVLLSAWLAVGKKEALKIITLSVTFPIILIVLENLNYNFISNDMILGSVYYGIIGGIGVGLVLKRGFSFGGTDTVAKILHQKVFAFISISEILLGIDGTIIASSAIIYDKKVALYAIISQVITVKVIDMVLFGFSSKKVNIEIISDEYEAITKYILHNVKRGVSSSEIKGGYMNLQRLKISTICSPREAMLIKAFIAQVDQNAFINVLPVISVWGKGAGFDRLVEEE